MPAYVGDGHDSEAGLQEVLEHHEHRVNKGHVVHEVWLEWHPIQLDSAHS